MKDYQRSFLCHPRKADAVVDTLTKLSMGRVAHVKKEKKELVRDMYWLARVGIQLVYSPKGGVMVYNGSKASFFMDV